MAVVFFLLFAASFIVNFYLASVIEGLQQDLKWWESLAKQKGWDV